MPSPNCQHPDLRIRFEFLQQSLIAAFQVIAIYREAGEWKRQGKTALGGSFECSSVLFSHPFIIAGTGNSVAFSPQSQRSTYPRAMARSHLQLAALATAAVPGLEVVSARAFGFGRHGDFESALLSASDGRDYVIRVPTSQRAESEQSADLVALRALSKGIRARLPFSISSYVGQTPASDTRAIVYEFVHGDRTDSSQLQRNPELCESIGRAISAIQSIPASFISDAGLPVLGPVEVLRGVRELLDRAEGTDLTPQSLIRRWREAVSDSSLWQFSPRVVNGSLDVDSLLVDGGALVGILGWQELRVDDPARDLGWAFSLNSPVVIEALGRTVFDQSALGDRASASTDRSERSRRGTELVWLRALLYSELELARWLLHGVSSRSTSVVDDAVSMLRTLESRVLDGEAQSLHPETAPTLTVDEVADFLDRS